MLPTHAEAIKDSDSPPACSYQTKNCTSTIEFVRKKDLTYRSGARTNKTIGAHHQRDEMRRPVRECGMQIVGTPMHVMRQYWMQREKYKLLEEYCFVLRNLKLSPTLSQNEEV